MTLENETAQGVRFDSLQLKNQLCFPLYSASRLIVQTYQPLLESLGGITYPQYLVLLVLWEKEGQTVKEISEKLFLDSGTLTPVLQKLQDAGLVDRRRSQSDDRCVQNFLTPRAQALKPIALNGVAEQFCRSGISLDQVSQIKRDINLLLEVLLKNRET